MSSQTPTRDDEAPDLADSASRVVHAALSRSVRIGRYTVIRELASGGMGTVYAAYDDELNRKVALKLVKFAGRRAGGQNAELRLLREAQALARLSHPNIVQIYEIGEFREQTYLAMEFVTGQTLGEWLNARPRSWREICAVLVDAGRGLAAAHAAGLVHRDFKPDNVLVGSDGRPRVVDFGLAREWSEPASSPNERAGADEPPGPLAELTREGALVGTPAYMSPEQLLRRAADARSDQFNYCVTLFESLYGFRPFAGNTLDELRAAITSSEPRPVPRTTRVPTRIHWAILRGLAKDPSERWADMDALIAALARDPARRWFQIGAVGLAVLSALIAGYGAARYEDEQAEHCQAALAEIADIWGDAQAERLSATFAALHTPWAPATLDRVVEGMNAYTSAWALARRRSCLAHRGGNISDRIYDSQVRCFERRRDELRASIDLLLAAGQEVAARGLELVQGLHPVDTCLTVNEFDEDMFLPDDSEKAADAALIERALTEIEIELRAGQYAAAWAGQGPITERVAALGSDPLHARALLLRGSAAMELGLGEEASRSLARAGELAVQSGAEAIAAEALAKQIFVSGVLLGKTEEPFVLRSLALALAERGGAAKTHLRALVYNNVGVVNGAHRRLVEALRDLELAVAELRSSPRNDAQRARTLVNMSVVRHMRRDDVRAESDVREALSILTRLFGGQHPDVLFLESALGQLLADTGKADAAIELLTPLLPRLQAVFGPRHVYLGMALLSLGSAHRARDPRSQRAVAYLERAASIWRDSAPDAPEYASALFELGNLMNTRGDHPQARTLCEASRSVYQRSSEPSHVAYALVCLARAACQAGDVRECRELAAEVLRRTESTDSALATLRSDARELLDGSENAGPR